MSFGLSKEQERLITQDIHAGTPPEELWQWLTMMREHQQRSGTAGGWGGALDRASDVVVGVAAGVLDEQSTVALAAPLIHTDHPEWHLHLYQWLEREFRDHDQLQPLRLELLRMWERGNERCDDSLRQANYTAEWVEVAQPEDGAERVSAQAEKLLPLLPDFDDLPQRLSGGSFMGRNEATSWDWLELRWFDESILKLGVKTEATRRLHEYLLEAPFRVPLTHCRGEVMTQLLVCPTQARHEVSDTQIEQLMSKVHLWANGVEDLDERDEFLQGIAQTWLSRGRLDAAVGVWRELQSWTQDEVLTALVRYGITHNCLPHIRRLKREYLASESPKRRKRQERKWEFRFALGSASVLPKEAAALEVPELYHYLHRRNMAVWTSLVEVAKSMPQADRLQREIAKIIYRRQQTFSNDEISYDEETRELVRNRLYLYGTPVQQELGRIEQARERWIGRLARVPGIERMPHAVVGVMGQLLEHEG